MKKQRKVIQLPELQRVSGVVRRHDPALRQSERRRQKPPGGSQLLVQQTGQLGLGYLRLPQRPFPRLIDLPGASEPLQQRAGQTVARRQG